MELKTNRNQSYAEAIMSNNATFDYMLRNEGPMTVERFVQLNWFGEKTLQDLEGEEWCDVWDFQTKVQELREGKR